MFRNNNIWLLTASIWIVSGTICAISGNTIGVMGSVFAVFMCLIYRDARNKLDKDEIRMNIDELYKIKQGD